MNNEQINFDENDEMTDEQYFSEESENSLYNRANGKMENREDEEEPEIDESAAVVQEEDDEDEYRVSSISQAFLRCECSIMNESSKTEITFSYRGDTYKGIVLKKINDSNYIFLVRPAGRGRGKAVQNAEMKKIYIPDAIIV